MQNKKESSKIKKKKLVHIRTVLTIRIKKWK